MKIDLNKYEGHTEGPWISVDDDINTPPDHYGFIDSNNEEIMDARNDLIFYNKGVDKVLVTDAPLLLQRCKELEARLDTEDINEKSLNYLQGFRDGNVIGRKERNHYINSLEKQIELLNQALTKAKEG